MANFLVDKQGVITGIIVESQGVFEVGDTHFFVPWKQGELGPNLSCVKVPVNERSLPDFTLFNDDESYDMPYTLHARRHLGTEAVRLRRARHRPRREDGGKGEIHQVGLR